MRSLIIFLCTFFFHLPSTNEDTNIDSLFLNWNRVTLNSLSRLCSDMEEQSDRSLCENRIATMPGFWAIEDDSLNRSSIRWIFLNKMENDSNKLSKDWTIVEVMKTGEKVSLVNYIISYSGTNANIIKYVYAKGEWIKINEKISMLKIGDFKLPISKTLLSSNSYPYDVIITNFKQDSVCESNYYLEHTIADSIKIVCMLKE
ncbi:hypothetical protein SAMN05444266_101145 [Chitinophaga jiangningensis]|uniref:Uncharacterized protein n=2 Tax=Chitinophaga jiangningensis TaxID=1419482 RepID=A0A1M6VBF2_9BACT|nr:hypothetical protein SAMN05444266_101145 [Chitinophaga jiangningensis]